MYMANIKACVFCAASLQLAITSAAYAESRISFLAAGEAYDGAPAFEIRMGDKVIGRGELTKAIDTVNEGRLFFSPAPDRYIERFEFRVEDKAFRANAPISIVLVNDKFKEEGWGRDRNLFVRSIEVNGLTVGAADLSLTDGVKVQNVNYQAGLLPVYHQNHMAVAEPPEGGWPAPANPRSSRLTVAPAAAGGAGG
ncbi:MAG TPA: carbohydrate-binding domain-containing protein [Aquamicrobium sp.]|nr:carbohydrate-binding domain-containing protein [Aquamicrobium sp.]